MTPPSTSNWPALYPAILVRSRLAEPFSMPAVWVSGASGVSPSSDTVTQTGLA